MIIMTLYHLSLITFIPSRIVILFLMHTYTAFSTRTKVVERRNHLLCLFSQGLVDGT